MNQEEHIDHQKEAAEFRLLFKTYIEDLRFCKRQQWYTLYITVGALSLLTTFALSVKSLKGGDYIYAPLFHTIIFVSIFIINAAGTFFLAWYFCSIKNFRRLKKEIITKIFNYDVLKLSEITDETENNADRNDQGLTLVFIVIILLSSGLAMLSLPMKPLWLGVYYLLLIIVSIISWYTSNSLKYKPSKNTQSH